MGDSSMKESRLARKTTRSFVRGGGSGGVARSRQSRPTVYVPRLARHAVREVLGLSLLEPIFELPGLGIGVAFLLTFHLNYLPTLYLT